MATTSYLDKTGTAYLISKVTALLSGKADSETTLSGYGITDAYTSTETDEAIAAAVSSAISGVYTVKGSVAFANLPTDAEAGDIYNVTDAFTTTESFAEGSGVSYPAGTNVVWTGSAWDAMAGTYDFSSYVQEDDLTAITEEEIDAMFE